MNWYEIEYEYVLESPYRTWVMHDFDWFDDLEWNPLHECEDDEHVDVTLWSCDA